MAILQARHPSTTGSTDRLLILTQWPIAIENGGIPLDSDVPDTGHVTYAGFCAICIDGHPDAGYLIGDAEVRADFVSSAFEGEVTDMAGTVNGQASVAWNGTLELSGEVGLTHTAGLEGTVNGSLSAGSDDLSIMARSLGSSTGRL